MSGLKDIYLEQLKKALMDCLHGDVPGDILDPGSLEVILRPEWFDHFFFGRALTLCGPAELGHLQQCIETCLDEGIAGDFIECGAWRGGATILMRGVLAAHGITDRRVWVADSFEGMPEPPPGTLEEQMYNYEAMVKADHLAVGIEDVRANFERFGLLDENVVFLEGWFEDTLPGCRVEQLALLRLDTGYYGSTATVLENLYPKLSSGGFLVIDDWGYQEVCGVRKAVVEYREAHGIDDEVVPVDWRSAYWRKAA